MSGMFASDFSWRADSDAFVFSGMRAVNQFNFYSDIYLHRLQGKGTMLTRAKRARDPSFRRDGKDLLVVTNDSLPQLAWYPICAACLAPLPFNLSQRG